MFNKIIRIDADGIEEYNNEMNRFRQLCPSAKVTSELRKGNSGDHYYNWFYVDVRYDEYWNYEFRSELYGLLNDLIPDDDEVYIGEKDFDFERYKKIRDKVWDLPYDEVKKVKNEIEDEIYG